MKLIERKYGAERGATCETYQAFTVTVESGNGRDYITVDLGHLSRWRSREEYASYMRWVADEIEMMEI